MKAPSNPMGTIRPFTPPPAHVQRFGQRLAALQSLQGRSPFWIKHEDIPKLGGIDAMPHPDLDIHNLTS